MAALTVGELAKRAGVGRGDGPLLRAAGAAGAGAAANRVRLPAADGEPDAALAAAVEIARGSGASQPALAAWPATVGSLRQDAVRMSEAHQSYGRSFVRRGPRGRAQLDNRRTPLTL